MIIILPPRRQRLFQAKSRHSDDVPGSRVEAHRAPTAAAGRDDGCDGAYARAGIVGGWHRARRNSRNVSVNDNVISRAGEVQSKSTTSPVNGFGPSLVRFLPTGNEPGWGDGAARCLACPDGLGDIVLVRHHETLTRSNSRRPACGPSVHQMKPSLITKHERNFP